MPTPEQTQAILAYLRSTRTDPKVIEVIDFQDKGARRISETCRLMWGDLEGMTILVRDMKHPQMKTGHTKRLAIPEDAYAVISRQPRESTNPQERIFKVSVQAVKAAYTRACKELKFDLHLHDSRRAALTKIIASGKTIAQAMQVSGHTNTSWRSHMAERAPTEVWIQPVSKSCAYVRIGEKDNLATVNRPEMAECVRTALQAFVDGASCANRAEG